MKDMELMERYEVLKSKVVRRREELRRLMKYIEQETAYLTAPASTRYISVGSEACLNTV